MQITLTWVTWVTHRIRISCFSLKDKTPHKPLFISFLVDLYHFFVSISAILLWQKKTRCSSAFSQNHTTKAAASVRYFSPFKTTGLFFYFISRIDPGSVLARFGLKSRSGSQDFRLFTYIRSDAASASNGQEKRQGTGIVPLTIMSDSALPHDYWKRSVVQNIITTQPLAIDYNKFRVKSQSHRLLWVKYLIVF